MKKILLAIICIFLFSDYVNAQEYTAWSEERTFDSIYEEQDIRFRFYQEIKEGIYTNDNNNYEFVEEDNFIYENYSEWLEDCSDYEDKGYDIDVKKLYPYQEILSGRYLLFSKFNLRIDFKNIDIKINGNSIDYKIYDSYFCPDDNCDYRNKDYLKIDLLDFYNLRDLKIYIDSDSNGVGCFSVWFGQDKDFSLVSAKKTACNHVTDITAIDKAWVSSSTVYSDIKYSETPLKSNDLDKIYEEITMCRYRGKLNYRYNIKRQYFDDNYYHDIENYIKDEQDYKIFYRYLIENNEVKENSLPVSKIENKNSCKIKENEQLMNDFPSENISIDLKEESVSIKDDELIKKDNREKSLIEKENVIEKESESINNQVSDKNSIIKFLQVRKNNLLKNKYIVIVLIILLLISLLYKRKMSIK